VGDFDLAAFYDTISHELLLKTLFPQTTNEDLDWVRKCLRTWSSDQADSGHGLIPQTGKFAIKRAHSVQDAMGMLPSISDPQHEAGAERIEGQQARTAFRSAIGGRPYRVTDKTRLRYVLFRAEPDAELLTLVVRLIPRHPEHTDAFFTYLGRFGYRKPIERLCQALVETNPYPYARGEAWHVLARYRRESRAAVFSDPGDLTTRAIDIARENRQENFVERWGVCHFLCVSDDVAG
jgi:hypothetical protein